VAAYRDFVFWPEEATMRRREASRIQLSERLRRTPGEGVRYREQVGRQLMTGGTWRVAVVEKEAFR
jgi:hypothetical protein